MAGGMTKALQYQSGFGNHQESESLPGALPVGRNSPRKSPYGLYAEQLSGSAFTSPRAENFRSWLYRIRPSVAHGSYEQMDSRQFVSFVSASENPATPNQYRWDPRPLPTRPTDFVESLFTVAVNGSAQSRQGCSALVYSFNRPMDKDYFYNADGEMLFVPENGGLQVRTEMGALEVVPTEICVVPRGVKFQINPLGDACRGYICENYGAPLRLPQLGPIGANGLANPRDFLAPVASYEDKAGDFRIIAKFQGALWECRLKHSPLDVVAWHGNYCPYKYDLKRFNTINTVSFDHPDPSIFTVLTSPTPQLGVANLDFVIFPPRWMVAQDTFRPPYFHRNCMSEFMGLIQGTYDAKAHGFVAGGYSLHNCMSAHGPDAETFKAASDGSDAPTYLKETLAFMFETFLVFVPTAQALQAKELQKDYLACWQGLTSHFNPKSMLGGKDAKDS